MIEPMLLFTILSGAGVVGAEILSSILSNADKKTSKLATASIEENKSLKNMLGDDGLFLTKGVRLKEKFDYEGVCVIGPTGSGKTTDFFYPNLLSNNIKGSIIVSDPKGELYKHTSNYQKNYCGRKVYRFSPLEPETSELYNPLLECKETSDVLQLAATLLFNGSLSIELQTGKKTGGAEWVQMAEPLFSAALLYAKEQEYPFNTINFALELLINIDTKNLEKIFSNAKNRDVMIQFNTFKVVGGADRTEGSIKITLATNLKLFHDVNIIKASSKTTFDISKFRKEPSILYICYPERKANYISPFVAPFFTQLMDGLLDSYSDKCEGIHFLFDEFANVGLINNISVNAATCRSRKINLTVCLQSITQIYNIYGVNIAKSLLNNLKTKIVLPGLNCVDTLGYISNLCGNTEIITSSVSTSKVSTYNYSKTKKPLFENSEVRTLDDDKMLIITSNKQPVIENVTKYFEHCEFTDNVVDNMNFPHKFFPMLDTTNKIEDLKRNFNNEIDEDEDFGFLNAAQRLYSRKV